MRDSIGATKSRIFTAVLFESILICVIGCTLGGAAGLLAFYKAMGQFSAHMNNNLPLGFPVIPLTLLLAVIIFVGILAGLQGASIATQANPAEIVNQKDVI
ncbi:MAG TPA: FtsX-like permease family protein [Armatimonadota bacterium]|nr:FtsX-like permease family protein [Armatimonadota bacterium]